jgi:hypothetical protein
MKECIIAQYVIDVLQGTITTAPGSTIVSDTRIMSIFTGFSFLQHLVCFTLRYLALAFSG